MPRFVKANLCPSAGVLSELPSPVDRWKLCLPCAKPGTWHAACCLLCSSKPPIDGCGTHATLTASTAGGCTQLSGGSADAAACWWGMGAGVGGATAGRWGLQELMMSNASLAVGRSAGFVAKHMSISCSISAGHSSGTCTHHGLLSPCRPMYAGDWTTNYKQHDNIACFVSSSPSRGQAGYNN